MAKIRKRTLPSGAVRWLVDYRDGGGARRAKMFKRKADADEFLVNARGEVRAGTHVADSQSMTVAQAADLWVQRGELDGLEATTVRQRRQHADLHIKPLIGTTRLSRLTAPAVQDFVDRLLESRSREMARRALTSLKGVIADAQRRGAIGHNPANAIKVAKRRGEASEQDGVAIPPKADLRAMLQKAAEIWPLVRTTAEGKAIYCCWRPLIVTAIFTGMRASELRGLAWPHVDLVAGVVRVRQRADRYNSLGTPKSKAGRRDIPMAPIVLNALKEWRLACPTTKLDLVFPSERGDVVWHTNLYNQCFRALLKACAIIGADEEPKVEAPAAEAVEGQGSADEDTADNSMPYTFHALRHAAASLFIEQGWSPKKVQTVMGHSSIQVTFDTYGHLFPTPDDDLAAMAQIEARLLG